MSDQGRIDPSNAPYYEGLFVATTENKISDNDLFNPKVT